MTAFTINPGPISAQFADACRRLDHAGFVAALWKRRLEIWPSDPDARRSIAGRLGWLGAIDFVTPQIARIRAFVESVRREGFTDVLLLGMGGSSLAPEVIRSVIGVAPGFPQFRMLDSVDPDAVRSAMQNVSGTLFILASKSGSTIEPNVMAAEAKRRVREVLSTEWGPRVIAITDDQTMLHRRSIEERFRDAFVNPSDIGGRYSALSLFGLVPAALMGVEIDELLASAREMEAACRSETASDNPGLALGALMAAGAREGRDKLVLVLPEPLHSFGLWTEQLIAESTGKQGNGIVPVAGNAANAHLGADSVMAVVTLGSTTPDPALLERVQAAGAPLAVLNLKSVQALGAEFLRWEVATAAAGWLFGVNPFDEPNVQQAKNATRVLLDVYQRQHHLPIPESHASVEGMRITMSAAAEREIAGDPVGAVARLAHLSDYVALLAYLPPDDPALAEELDASRLAIADATGCATVAGYGPRYLHSTGQLHKGGPNSGVFVVITAEADEDLAIPGEPFSFGVLEMAQALGDFQSLDRAGRRALQVHLPTRDPALLRRLTAVLLGTS